jgi:predicted O-linked N-acetylglucosamine transferase (SPINDLY family)
VASLIQQDQIDILVDLSGFTEGNRLLVFARKPAPIQITAWGYIGGTGMKAMDVFFADEVVVPPEERALYAEEVRYLPSVVCYYPFEPFPPVNALPALMGRGLTFGSFNRLAKITEASFRVWAEVLLAVPHSRMVLKTPELDQLSEQERIRDRFVAYGVAPERVVLLGRTSWAEHVAAFNQVDIGLDPFPHGGGVTALEGLMMGVPVVTLKWPTIPGRLSAAILTPLGLTDWIADSPEAYVRIAVEKSRDLMALSVLRKQLRGRMTSSLIGDPKAYARAVESEYRLLWQEWCAR